MTDEQRTNGLIEPLRAGPSEVWGNQGLDTGTKRTPFSHIFVFKGRSWPPLGMLSLLFSSFQENGYLSTSLAIQLKPFRF